MAASLVLNSPISTAGPFLLGVTGDTTCATSRHSSHVRLIHDQSPHGAFTGAERDKAGLEHLDH